MNGNRDLGWKTWNEGVRVRLSSMCKGLLYADLVSVRCCCARAVFGIVLVGLDTQPTEVCVAVACPKLMHFLIIVKYTKVLDDPRMIR